MKKLSENAERIRLSVFARRLGKTWQDSQLPTDANVIVAVSGGADSTALLLALDELTKSKRIDLKIIVAHLDHGLRKQSKADALCVSGLAQRLGYEFKVTRVNVARRAKTTGDNLEQAARRARYEFLQNVAKQKRAKLVLTAHTLDDQAETVLLRLMRGSGPDGLAGIAPVRPFEPQSDLLLARPLIGWARRSDTEKYCQLRQTEFLSDEMNEDESFARVRVRKQLLPLMQTFNPRIVEGLARTAELLRDDLDVLECAADVLLNNAADPVGEFETETPRLRVDVLTRAPVSLRRRALRRWIVVNLGDLRRFEMVHIRAIEGLIKGERGGRIAELPGGGFVIRRRGWIELRSSIQNREQ